MEPRLVSAIVLAGGRSSRFGSDKLAADLDGRPLLAHAIEAVATIADEVVLVLAPDAAVPGPTTPASVRVVRDRDAFAGPLAGLREGAAAARHGTLVVVGGDMPGLVPAVLRLLVGAIEAGADAAILGAGGPGTPVPLPMALDRAAVTTRIEELLATDRRSLRALLAELRTTTLAHATWRPLDPDARTLHDVDRPEDLPAR